MTTVFAGKTALITGAGRSIGRAIALGLADTGAGLILLARSARQLDETHADAAALDGRDALLGDVYGLGDAGLGQAGLLAHLGQVLGTDLQCPLLSCFLYGRAVVGVDELIQELLAGAGEELAPGSRMRLCIGTPIWIGHDSASRPIRAFASVELPPVDRMSRAPRASRSRIPNAR